jgi:hypothetical protein
MGIGVISLFHSGITASSKYLDDIPLNAHQDKKPPTHIAASTTPLDARVNGVNFLPKLPTIQPLSSQRPGHHF